MASLLWLSEAGLRGPVVDFKPSLICSFLFHKPRRNLALGDCPGYSKSPPVLALRI